MKNSNNVFLKIQYGPTSSKYFFGFNTVKYVSYSDLDALAINLDNVDQDTVLVHDKFLDEEFSCAKHESRKNCWYLNKIVLGYPAIKDMLDPLQLTVLFTGNAYLMSGTEGKTVDMLR